MSRVEYDKQYHKRHREENRERQLAANRRWYKKHREKEAARKSALKEKNPERWKEILIQGKNYRDVLKRATFMKLGGPCCAKCGVNDERVLVVDHLNDNGAEERRCGSYCDTTALYRKILHMSDADANREYQVLCANHNMIKEVERRERNSEKYSAHITQNNKKNAEIWEP